MTLIADFFPKLRTPENVARYMSNKSRLKGPFDRQHGKRVQTLLQSGQQPCYHIYWSFGRQLSRKKSVLVRRKALYLFVNTLTADDKYSLLNRDNLTQPIRTQLSQKRKAFSQFFLTFSKSALNLEHFQKKDDAHSWFLSEITHSGKRG